MLHLSNNVFFSGSPISSMLLVVCRTQTICHRFSLSRWIVLVLSSFRFDLFDCVSLCISSIHAWMHYVRRLLLFPLLGLLRSFRFSILFTLTFFIDKISDFETIRQKKVIGQKHFVLAEANRLCPMPAWISVHFETAAHCCSHSLISHIAMLSNKNKKKRKTSGKMGKNRFHRGRREWVSPIVHIWIAFRLSESHGNIKFS